MATDLAVGSTEFQSKVLQSELPVLVDFWAEWCQPCKAIGPHVEQVAQEFAGRANVFKLDVDKDGDIAAQYGVMSIPALLVFKGGKVVDSSVGLIPKAEIAAMLQRNL